SSFLRDVENHSDDPAAEKGSDWEHGRTSVGRDGNHRAGHAYCVRKRDQFVAGAGRSAAAGVGGARGTGRGLGAHRMRTSRGERDAGSAGRSCWSGVSIRGRAIFGGGRPGEFAAHKRDFDRWPDFGVHAAAFDALGIVVRPGSRAEIRGTAEYAGVAERWTNDQREPGTAPRTE